MEVDNKRHGPIRAANGEILLRIEQNDECFYATLVRDSSMLHYHGTNKD
jgi:hypothetical protein